jgi:hypothetical protein
MFRAITKGFTELLKRRPSIEVPHLPETATAIRESISQNQPPAQHNNQPKTSTEQPKSAPNFRRSSTANSLSRLTSSSGINPSQLAEMKPTKTLPEDNWVKVRIWTSKTGEGQDTYAVNAILGGGNVGHATLETNKIYASIWPERGASDPKQILNSNYISEPIIDMQREALEHEELREPDYVFIFYSLNAKSIEDAFKQIKEAKEPWTLFGNLNGKGYSCSSLTLFLLEKGGLDNLAAQKIRGLVSPTSNLASSPNNLVNQLLYASRIEKIKYPEIIDFSKQNNEVPINKEPFIISIKADKFNLINVDNKQENEVLLEHFIKPKPGGRS